MAGRKVCVTDHFEKISLSRKASLSSGLSSQPTQKFTQCNVSVKFRVTLYEQVRFTVTSNISAFTFQFFRFTIFSCRLRAVD